MFSPKSWASAFVNSAEKNGANVDDALAILMSLASWAASQKDAPFGRSASDKLEPLIRKVFSGAGEGRGAYASNNAGDVSFAQETALRFFLVMTRKNRVRHIDSIISEIKKSLDKKRGIVRASVEFAFPPEKDFESLIMDAAKKRTGAKRVELTGRLNPELMGGYRLRIGDEIIDASIRSQLRGMETCLAAMSYNLGEDGDSGKENTETDLTERI